MTKVIFSVLILVTSTLWAQEKQATPPPTATNTQLEHIQMHEKMSKAHQQAADCLKSGKPVEECRTEFHGMCSEAGSPGKCGPWMHHKMWRKGK